MMWLILFRTLCVVAMLIVLLFQIKIVVRSELQRFYIGALLRWRAALGRHRTVFTRDDVEMCRIAGRLCDIQRQYEDDPEAVEQIQIRMQEWRSLANRIEALLPPEAA